MNTFHKPVLLQKAIEYLNVQSGKEYIDATVGGGGHSEAILKKGGKLLAIDCDPEAIEAAKKHLSSACPDAFWQPALGNFVHLKEIAEKHGFSRVAGILFDLGVSSHQLETADRGFSFNLEGPLDMRMDPSLPVTATDLVNGLNKGELDELFSKLGEEHYSRRIAEAICRSRRIAPITTGNQLTEIIIKARPKRGFDRINPATRCFQALRIAVNDEFNNLKEALPEALEILKPGGRLVVISFHSGEDRIVKRFLKEAESKGKVKLLTKKPIRPENNEVATNPRSRSAKLRAGEKNNGEEK